MQPLYNILKCDTLEVLPYPNLFVHFYQIFDIDKTNCESFQVLENISIDPVQRHPITIACLLLGPSSIILAFTSTLFSALESLLTSLTSLLTLSLAVRADYCRLTSLKPLLTARWLSPVAQPVTVITCWDPAEDEVPTFPNISVTCWGTPNIRLVSLSPERWRCQERRRRDQGRIQRVEEETRE